MIGWIVACYFGIGLFNALEITLDYGKIYWLEFLFYLLFWPVQLGFKILVIIQELIERLLYSFMK